MLVGILSPVTPKKNICRWPVILSESAPPAPARPLATAAAITPAGIEAQVNAYGHWSPHKTST